jgi:DNA-binding MarR family transcriptional regulator
MHRFADSFKQGHDHYREQSRLLLLIAQNDGIIQRDLAEEMDVRPSSMTEILLKMEELGLVVRKQDERDQRVVHIFLTEGGKAAAEKSKNSIKQLTDALFKSFSDEEIKQMLQFTLKLCDGISLTTLDEDKHKRRGHLHGLESSCKREHHHHHAIK